jgi:hypothetical protein
MGKLAYWHLFEMSESYVLQLLSCCKIRQSVTRWQLIAGVSLRKNTLTKCRRDATLIFMKLSVESKSDRLNRDRNFTSGYHTEAIKK